MAGRGNRSGRVNRRKDSGRKALVALIVVACLIGALFAGLEFIKGCADGDRSTREAPGQVRTLPVPTQHPLTSARPIQGPMTTMAAQSLPPKAELPPIPAGKPGKVAIIVDDMGSSLGELKALMGIGLPLTFSVIPGLARDREVARTAVAKGYQVMLHIPMEPEGYPGKRLEANGLLVAHPEAEIRRRMASYLEAVPGASGANNHMGSRFTTQGDKMQTVVQVLKERDLFFVDSLTSPRSVGFAVAGQMGVRTAARQVFIDNEQDVGKIRRQLLQLAAVARKRGEAIGICHPHPSTIKALQLTLPALAGSGITFVSAGDLVR